MEKFHPVMEKCPLFDGIRMEDLGAMMGCIGGRMRQVAKGEIVLREGDPATHVGMVLSGAVQMVREDYYGNRSIVAHIGPAELFGESVETVQDENGNDVVVDDLLAIVVTNISGEYLEYAKITLESAKGDCSFVISALPAGESVLVQEYQAAAYAAGNNYAFKDAEMYFYDSLPSLMTDRYLLEGAANSISLTNLQTQNVNSPVCVYYKTYVGGMYFGGITYRVRFDEGLPAGQTLQNGAGHYLPGSSRLMFITEEAAN